MREENYLNLSAEFTRLISFLIFFVASAQKIHTEIIPKTIRCIDDSFTDEGVCIISGRKSKQLVYFAKAY